MVLNKKILIFVEEDYEDLELHYPKLRLIEAGAEVVVAAPIAKEIYKGKRGYPCKGSVLLDTINPEGFDALIVPGGMAPDHLRTNPKVLDITRHFHEKKKLIAFICHGGWVPISAGVLKGVKCTSYIAIKDDMINAGAIWSDAPVVVDRHFVSSRKPDDLPDFCKSIIKFLSDKEIES